MTITSASDDQALQVCADLLDLLDRIAYYLGRPGRPLDTDGSLRVTSLIAWDRAVEVGATLPDWGRDREIFVNTAMIYLGHAERFLYKVYRSSLAAGQPVNTYTASQITGWLRGVAEEIQRCADWN
ncbi:hypothetical protein [Streptomyces sp. NRRL S-350]|uniref:hypothetical protein n=1 Tax=Streptomyces sp. NRRL S-350 TaxID=1463902 RepID=UPI0004C1F2FA|nr:hypothetical protein [Streptomyces sp. NRRL S-350]